jgi:hypothetical protein
VAQAQTLWRERSIQIHFATNGGNCLQRAARILESKMSGMGEHPTDEDPSPPQGRRPVFPPQEAKTASRGPPVLGVPGPPPQQTKTVCRGPRVREVRRPVSAKEWFQIGGDPIDLHEDVARKHLNERLGDFALVAIVVGGQLATITWASVRVQRSGSSNQGSQNSYLTLAENQLPYGCG